MTKRWFKVTEGSKQSSKGCQGTKQKCHSSVPWSKSTIINNYTRLCVVGLTGTGQFNLCVKQGTANYLCHCLKVSSCHLEYTDCWVKGTQLHAQYSPTKSQPVPDYSRGRDKWQGQKINPLLKHSRISYQGDLVREFQTLRKQYILSNLFVVHMGNCTNLLVHLKVLLH